MSKRSAEQDATYGPLQFKSFPGALNAFFSSECPQLGGQRTRQVLVQAIVQAHGGTVAARSLPEGGAEFTVLLPSPTLTNL